MGNDNVIELIVKVVDQATQQLESLTGVLRSFGAIAATAGAGFSLKEMIDDTIVAQNSTFLLTNALKNAGLESGGAAVELEKFAAQVQATTQFSEHAAQAVEALGLRMGLSVNVIEQAVTAATNLAAANPGQTLEEAGNAVVRALANPLQAIRGLRQEHVTFNQEQQFTIQNLVKTGEIAQAQALILQILSNSYTGAATAARDTLGGALSALKNNFESLLALNAGQTSGLVTFLNSVSDGLVMLKQALTNTLPPMKDVSDGFKIFAGAVAISIEIVKNLADSLINTLGSAFKAVGTLIGGISAAFAQMWHFDQPNAGNNAKDILRQTFSDVGDILAQGANATHATLANSVESILSTLDQLWNQTARISEAGAAKAFGTNKNAPSGASLAQLTAIKEASDSINTDISKMATQALSPLNELQQKLYEDAVAAKLAKVGIADIPSSIRDLLDALNSWRQQSAQADTLRTLTQEGDQLRIQASLGVQAADALALYTTKIQLAAAGVKDMDDKLKQVVLDNQSLKNDVFIKQLQDQLALEQLTTSEKEKQQNLQKLGANATQAQKDAVGALTDQMQQARANATAVNDLQNAFQTMFEAVGSGTRGMIDAFANAFKQILAKALATDLVSALGLNQLSTKTSSGGTSGSTLGAILNGLVSIFGHAGGTSGDAKPFWAGEAGPELIVPGGTTSVYNQRQLAFSGDSGSNVNFNPQYSVVVQSANADQTKADLVQFFAVQMAKDRADLYRTLARNGVGPRSGLR